MSEDFLFEELPVEEPQVEEPQPEPTPEEPNMPTNPLEVVNMIHAAFDEAHTDCCPERWPKILDMLRLLQWEKAKAQVRGWQEVGHMTEEGTSQVIVLIDYLASLKPTTMC